MLGWRWFGSGRERTGHGRSDDGGHPSLSRRVVDTFFGYDYFISYCHDDGELYATLAARALRDHGRQCFLDSDEFRAGDHWKKVGTWTLRRSTCLVLVGSPAALQSKPVLHEVQTFSHFRKNIVPIDFDGSLHPAGLPTELLPHLPEERIRLLENGKCLDDGPSPETITRLIRDFKGITQQKRRMLSLAVAAVSLLAVSAAAIWQWQSAATQRDLAWRQARIVLSQSLAGQAVLQQGTPIVVDDALQSARVPRYRDDERAALLARQAYVFNSRIATSATPLIDSALRTAMTAPYFGVSLPHCSHPVFDGSGSRLAAICGLGIKIWTLSDKFPRLIARIKGKFVSLAHSPAAPVLAAGDSRGAISFWDLGGSVPRQLASRRTHNGVAEDLAFSPDGHHVATRGRNGLRIWKTSEFPPQTKSLAMRRARISAMTFAPNGHLAVGDRRGRMVMIDPETGKLVGRVARADHASDPIEAIAFKNDGIRMAATGGGRDCEIVLYQRSIEENDSWNAVSSLPAIVHKDGLSFSADGKWIATSVYRQSKTILWDVEKAFERSELPNRNIPHVDIELKGLDSTTRFCPASGCNILSTSDSDGQNRRPSLRLWHPQPSISLNDPISVALALPYPTQDPDGEGRYASANGHVVAHTRTQSWGEREELAISEGDSQVASRRARPGDQFRAVHIGADGRRLVFADRHHVWMWTQEDRRLKRLASVGSKVHWAALGLRDDGTVLGANQYAFEVFQWNVAAHDRPRMILDLRGKLKRLSFAIATFAPSGDLVAFSDREQIRVADLATKDDWTLRGRYRGIRAMAISPDGKSLAASDDEKRVLLWNIEEVGSEPAVVANGDLVSNLSFNADGRWIIGRLSGTRASESVRAWPTTAELARVVCERIGSRELPSREWPQFVGSDVPFESTCGVVHVQPAGWRERFWTWWRDWGARAPGGTFGKIRSMP